jgi:hypothetical protein
MFALNPVKLSTVILIKSSCELLPVVIIDFSFGMGCVKLIKEIKIHKGTHALLVFYLNYHDANIKKYRNF